MPEVSVIIPVYNCAGLIGAALRSVFAQTFTDFEVIIVDDGSQDGTALRAALAPWQDRFTYIRQANGGPASARNTGLSRARGRLIAFLDADDEWMPEKLARQIEYFARYPETGLLHTAMLDHAGAPRAARAEQEPPQHRFCDLFHTRFFINTLTVVVPRAVLQAVGGFDERREIHVEDWDLWLRIAAAHPIGYIAEPLALHRPGGLMSRHLDRTYTGQALVVEKNRHLCASACAEHRANPDACLRIRRHVLHRDWGTDRLHRGDAAGGRAQLRQALALRPWDAATVLRYLKSLVRRPGGGAPEAGASPSVATGAPPARRWNTSRRSSVVQDTTWRRLRRHVAAKAHDLDEAVTCRRGGRRRLLVDASSPMSLAIMRPVYERLQSDPRVELWFTGLGDVWDRRALFGAAGITTRIVPPGRAAWMKFDACLNTDFWDMTWIRRRTRRIHMFHGVAGKYQLDAPVEIAPLISTFDCLMFPNADRRDRYVTAGLVSGTEPAAALVGYPKVDCLVDGSIDRNTVLERLNLRTDGPTAIYAPTWSPYSSLQHGEEIIDRLADAGLQVIVKLHDRSYDLRPRGSGGVDWSKRLARYTGHPRVRVVREADASPFLVAADLMVTDHSSVAFEFMLLDRPLVVIDCPELVRQAQISQDKVERLRAGARVVSNVAEVGRAAERELRDPSRHSAARRRVAGELFYRPGSATNRAVTLLYEALELDEPAPATRGTGARVLVA
jgi:hypothetical protein